MVKELAIFGMGCFWGPQALFDKTPGVLKTEVGYMGGHTEVVRIEFDNGKLSYGKILKIFWANHNPLTGHRQGLNIGKQYRPAIFYNSEKQKKLAQETKKKVQENHKFRKVATKIEKAGKFYKAEEHHQKYLKKNRRAVC